MSTNHGKVSTLRHVESHRIARPAIAFEVGPVRTCKPPGG